MKISSRAAALAAGMVVLAAVAPDQFHAGDGGHAVFAEEALPAARAALHIAGR